MSIDSSDDGPLETESVYKIVVKDLANAPFEVRLSLGEQNIDDEPVEIVSFDIVDLLTKSVYQGKFDGDDVARMGSYIELEKLFVILQSALSGMQNGSDSTTHKIKFGYIDLEQEGEKEEKTDVAFDRRSMTRAKKALKKKYGRINTNAAAGSSLICTVKYSSDLFSEFFAFPLPITNGKMEDGIGRLVDMMKDRKNEIDESNEEIKNLKDEINALKERLNVFEEGKHSEGVQVAQYFPSGNPGTDHIKFDSCSFDLLGTQYVERDASDASKFNVKKAGYYRVIAQAYLYGSSSSYIRVYVNGTAGYIVYGGAGTTHWVGAMINRIYKFSAGDYFQIYTNSNNAVYGTEQQSLLQIQLIQEE